MILPRSGVVKKGTETVNNNSIDMTNWIVTLKDHKTGGITILIKNVNNKDFDSEYDYWVKYEEDVPKFFAETDWEIEWDKDFLK